MFIVSWQIVCLKKDKKIIYHGNHHTCGDVGSLYKNESKLFFFPLSLKLSREVMWLPPHKHFPWVSHSPRGVSQSTHTYGNDEWKVLFFVIHFCNPKFLSRASLAPTTLTTSCVAWDSVPAKRSWKKFWRKSTRTARARLSSRSSVNSAQSSSLKSQMRRPWRLSSRRLSECKSLTCILDDHAWNKDL